MGKREEFINALDYYELAFLYKYKYDTYMPDTKAFIDEVITRKGLDKSSIENMVAERETRPIVDDKERCKRCGSDKMFYFETGYDNKSSKGNIYGGNGFSSEMVKETNQECAVCGFSQNLGVVDKSGNARIIKIVGTVALVVYFFIRFLMWIFDL